MRGMGSSWTTNTVLSCGRGKRLPNALQVRPLLRDDEAHTGTVLESNQPATQELHTGPVPIHSLLRGILFTRSHLVPLVTNCEMTWGVVWQRNTAWPTGTEIYFYQVDKQVSKLNIQYDPNFIFKIVLKNIYIYTQIYINIF